MDKWNTQFILVMLCSKRDTKIVRLEGLWFVSRPKCSVSEDPDDSPEVLVCSPFIVSSQNRTRDPCDIISWCHDHLLWSSGRKTTVHAHWKHHSLSAHLLAPMPESLITINASEPLHLFLNLNSVPVTYIHYGLTISISYLLFISLYVKITLVYVRMPLYCYMQIMLICSMCAWLYTYM